MYTPLALVEIGDEFEYDCRNRYRKQYHQEAGKCVAGDKSDDDQKWRDTNNLFHDEWINKI